MENLGKVFIQKVLARGAHKVYLPFRVENKEGIRILLRATISIWAEKYHNSESLTHETT